MNVHSAAQTPVKPHDGDSTRIESARGELAAEPEAKTHVKVKYFALVAVAGGLIFLIGLFAGLSGRDVPFASAPEPPTMMQCISNTLGLLDLKQPSTAALQETGEYCYSVVRSQGLLNDFTVRKLNFVQQYRANGILMWMVVVITISGVILAGLQLFASYQLAVTQRTALAGSDELSLKRDQIVLKSSVTGVLILLLSFAFFLVYVLYVYRFERPNEQDVQNLQQILNLPIGKLGASPATPVQ
jgi:hypothetical protein